MAKKKTSSKKSDGKLEVSHSHSKTMREKKIKKAEEEKEERLEEEVEQAEKEFEQSDEETFFEEPIKQIFPSIEISAPILERIIQREVPVQPLIETEQTGREEDKKRINYSPTNEPKYGFVRRTEEKEKKYETNFVPPVLTRRELFSEGGMRREFLKPSENIWSNQSNEQQLNEIDFVEQEARLPFEEQQKKYKRAKLR
jgi:hypothetical protein